MNDIPRQKLQNIVAQYDRSVWEDPKQCKELLLELGTEYKREIHVLIWALEEKIVADLMAVPDTMTAETLLEEFAQRLYDNLGIAEEFAYWAVESWALILAEQNSVESQPSATPQQKVIEDIEFILVKGGTFEMGDLWGDGFDFEKPVHPVSVGDFYLSKNLIINPQYAKFLNIYGSDVVKEGDYKGQEMISEHEWGLHKVDDEWLTQSGYENHPVVFVTWFGAYEFCRFYGFRLPTEAEWEYVARSGGQKEKWAGTDNISDLAEFAWFEENSDGKPHPVGSKKANGLGLHDMSGNLWEWCHDWYEENYYHQSPQHNPRGPSLEKYRILRGGSWYYTPEFIRTAHRNWSELSYSNGSRGFRVARDA